MAGLIARLLGGGGTSATEPAEPAKGIGGYTAGAGPANQSGFPGSTSQVRTFPSNGRVPNSPRAAKINGDYDTDANSRTGTAVQEWQASYRPDAFQARGASGNNPRMTPSVPLAQAVIPQLMQNNSRSEFYGGLPDNTHQVPGNNTVGGETLSPARLAGGHSAIDTTTPLSRAQPILDGNTPGAQNVRNTIAERYKNPAGQMHTYKSASRADQAEVNPGGQATDGNVNGIGITQDVTVMNRMVTPEIGWSVLREMPYGGRGNGARGADLNGQRYYATGQSDEFLNAGQGGFGNARLAGSGNKRPVAFTQPAPWTANYYDTTEDVGTQTDPNSQPAQQPNSIYYSPGGLRASNSTGRMG